MDKGETSGRREIANIMAIPNIPDTTRPCDKLEHILDLIIIGMCGLEGGAWERLYLSLLCSEILLHVQSHFTCSVHGACNVYPTIVDMSVHVRAQYVVQVLYMEIHVHSILAKKE